MRLQCYKGAKFGVFGISPLSVSQCSTSNLFFGLFLDEIQGSDFRSLDFGNRKCYVIFLDENEILYINTNNAFNKIFYFLFINST